MLDQVYYLHEIFHLPLYFLSLHAALKVCLYTKKVQVTHGIFYGIPLKNIYLHNNIIVTGAK